MVAFNFSPEFADDVATGKKLQTIRRTRRGKPGDRTQLYTGQRTKACRRLRNDDPPLEVVDYVHLAPDGITFGNKVLHPDVEGFARMDGFPNYAAMHAWFKARYGKDHFVGYVHRWKDVLDEAGKE